MADVILREAQGKSEDVTSKCTSVFSLAAQTSRCHPPHYVLCLMLASPCTKAPAVSGECEQPEFIVQWFCAPDLHRTLVSYCEWLAEMQIS